jgi:hypothetical protein
MNKLKGNFDSHGSEINVHVQNSMQMMEALIQATNNLIPKFIQTIITVFTVENQNSIQKMTNFIKENL